MSAGRTLSYRHLVAVSAIQAISILAGGPSVAGGAVSSESDILGIKLSMSRDQAKQFIQQQFGTSDFPPIAVELGTPEYNLNVGVGFSADVTPKKDKEANQTQLDNTTKLNEQLRANGCNSAMCLSTAPQLLKDALDIYFDPNDGGTAMLAMTRHAIYPEGSDILYSAFVQALTDKFGSPPQFMGDSYNHYWADVPVSKNHSELFECMKFAENFGNRVGAFEDKFPLVMNGFGNRQLKQPKCGTYARVYIEAYPKPAQAGTPSDYNTKYVRKFDMLLVNVRAGYGGLNSYAANFWAAANKAKQDKLIQQSQNKPKL
jgi:hypothetical protein